MNFTTSVSGKPTNFEEKILACVTPNGFRPKKHSIRKGKRWRAGMTLHMCTGGRTPHYHPFNKEISELQKVMSVQDIKITYNELSDFPLISIDGRTFSIFRTEDLPTLERLAFNDGFDSFSKFLDWFSVDFSGQIIHWTTERY